MIARAMQAWRRRYWRADADKLKAFDGLRPFVVVTGGSDGIGVAIAQEFARRGEHVLLVARTAEKLEAARAKFKHYNRQTPGLVIAMLALDVTATDAPHQIDVRLQALGGYCDVLVNSAGVGAAGLFASTEVARIDALTELNVVALTRLTRHVLPGMLTRGRGGVLNVSSLGGFAPGPYQAAYYASKCYVTHLTEALAHECAGLGVRIAVLAPGPVRTEFHQRMRGDTGLYLRWLPVPSAQATARTAVFGFQIGQRVIVPSLFGPLFMIALRIMPHRLSNPIISFLLKPRE